MFLLCGAKLGVELYKAYMRSYYAKTAALIADDKTTVNNAVVDTTNSNDIVDTIEVLPTPTKYLPFECSSKDTSSFGGHTYYDHFREGSSENDKFIYHISDGTLYPMFETETVFSVCAYINGAVYLNNENGLYRICIDENGNYDANSFSYICDIYCKPVCVGNNEMYLKVIGEQNEYYLLLNTLTGEYEQVYDFNQYLTETSKASVSKDEAEKIALKAIKKEDVEEEMLLYADCGINEKEYETVLMHNPDLSIYNINVDESIEYCWKVELVANIPDWWMPSATMYINAQTGEVVHCKVFLPD